MKLYSKSVAINVTACGIELKLVEGVSTSLFVALFSIFFNSLKKYVTELECDKIAI